MPGRCRIVTVHGTEIGLFKVADGYRAYLNSCPHAGAPVCRGELTGEILRCPWHAWDFDLATGACLANPGCRLQSFPVEVVDGQLIVQFPH